MVKKLKQRLKEKKGFLLFEVVITLVFISLIIVMLNFSIKRQEEEADKASLAEHFDKVLMAATKHFEDELCLKGIKQAITNGTITTSMSAMNPTMTTVNGITGVCGANMTTLNNFLIDDTLFDEMKYISPYNKYQQNYYGTIRATADGKPLLLMYTKHRNSSVDYTTDRIRRFSPILAGYIGSYAGYVPETNASLGTNKNIALGAGRGWEYNLSTAGINNGVDDVKPGNMVAVKILGERSVFVDIKDDHLLHRKDDPDDPLTKEEEIELGYNAMEWNLNMSGNMIENIGGLQFKDNKNVDCADTANVPDGTVFYKNNGQSKNLYVCVDGKAQEVSTSGSAYTIKDIQLVEANATSADKYITPPVCTDVNGNFIEPTAFISPTVMSSAEIPGASATGDSIIAVKTWIDRVAGKWKPVMEVLTITNKKIKPKGEAARVLVMSICPRTDII